MSKKLSTRERALLATANPVSAPSPSSAPVAAVVESVDDVVIKSPSRPRTGLGIASAQFFKNDEATAENDRLRSELQVWEGAHATKKLDPNLIKPSKWANRHELSFSGSDFEELKKEIESAGGNVQPIKVRPIFGTTPQTYEIVFGHRRHRACLELGIDVLAMIESIGDQEVFAEMDRENRQRADLRPYEQGVMYARALDEGLFSSLRKLTESLGVDVGNASKAVTLACLPAQVLAAFESPLDLLQAWATPLSKSLEKDPDIVLSRAASLSKMNPRPTALNVFKELIGEGVVLNNTLNPESRTIKGTGGKSGKIGFNPKKKTFEISLVGLDATKMKVVEAAIKALIS